MPATRKLSLAKMICVVFAFCAAMAVASAAQTFTTLQDFNVSNGYNPRSAALLQASDGSFYGTTWGGGTALYGTVFKITPTGTLTTIYNFGSQPGDGIGPDAPLVLGTDGNFYGTTYAGGSFNNGTVFRITPAGTMTVLYSFPCSSGNCPNGSVPNGVVLGNDGNFYGTTEYGGGAGPCCGTVFKITPSGTLTLLYNFGSSGGANGSNPGAGLVLGTDGNFYGTTGALGGGNVFKITPAGILTVLYSFCSLGNCSDGEIPNGLVQGIDGNFYGTTMGGGVYDWGQCDYGSGPLGCGTVFKITPGGTLTTLYSFCSQFPCRDGQAPAAALVQGTDGNFYGTTKLGGTYTSCLSGYGCGTIFKITPAGSLTTLHSFDDTDGNQPLSALVQGTDGKFYGTTWGGATYNDQYCNEGCGTVFSLAVSLSPFVETQPTSGNWGTPVTIFGTHLTGSTSVTFNGTTANFIVVSDSEITTNVPTGATTGSVQVTTPGGTLTSNAVFQVIMPLQFVPITPCRLVDTRQNHNPIQGGTSRNFTIPQLGGCNIPASAAAYSLNVSVVPHGPLGYLTIWPTGEDRSFVSTMNSLDGRIKANAAIVPASNDSVSVYVTNTTDIILDIDGYFAPVSGSTLAFYPLTPCRVADTRHSGYPPGLGPPFLTGGQERAFPILNAATTCNIPSSGAAVYSLNFSVVPHGSLFYMTVWPTGETRPLVSTLNDIPGQIIANAAIVVAGTSGDVSVYPTNDTDLVIDINGYFAAAGPGGLSLYGEQPCRVIDTRHVGTGQPFSGTLSPPVDVVGSPCGVPSTAQAYVFNASVVPTGGLGYLTLWPDGAAQPLVSTLNALDGSISSNMAIVPSTNGKVDAYASGLTQLILDISSYFAP